MRESQEVEGLRLAEVPLLPLLGGKPPKLDQPRLLSMQFQAELREPVAELHKERRGIISIMEARHVVIGKPYEKYIPARVPPPPLVGPQVEDIVEIDVREQRRCRCPLRRPLRRL